MLLIIIVIGIFEINIIPFISPSIKWLNIVFHSIFGQFLIIYRINLHFSVQFSRSILSESLRPHEPQHARPHCPSPTPRVHPNPCPWVMPIQLSHPLSSPSPPAPNPSQHQGLFQWVNSSHEVAKVLEFQLRHQSFQWTPRTDLL